MREKKSPAAARVSAAVALLDRGWGKPQQPLTGEDGGAIKVEDTSMTEVARRLAFVLTQGAREKD